MSIASTYAGLRVLDLSTNLAGPLAAMVLADLGADVIKVERPEHGDDTRTLPPQWDGESTVFLAVNRGKRSIVLDLAAEDGRAALLDLVEGADVVIESFGPGVAQRLELTFEDFKARNGDIILCDISAYGDGPIGSELPGYDGLIQAFTGMMDMTGHEGQAPARVAPSAVDISTGLWAAIGIQGALKRRSEGGGGQRVDVALVDSAFMLMCHQVLGVLATGDSPKRLGSATPSAAPYEAFMASDGYLVLAVANDRQWLRLCDALGLAELAGDPDLQTSHGRVARRAELSGAIQKVLWGDSVDAWIERLGTARIPVGRVNDLKTALAHPLTEERRILVGRDGSRMQLRLPIDSDGSAVSSDPPSLGAHADTGLGNGGARAAWSPREA
jgi:crotonobetainyl-CoA:carnitine CoA-transferase CaiB-like acyl-CoA transferase